MATHKAYPEDLIVITDPEHPLYQERALREIPAEEIATAKTFGIADILICAKLPGFDKPVVVAGRQRRNALLKANASLSSTDRHMLEYKLIKGDLKELVGIMIQENALRTDLTPLEKARDAQKLLGMGEDRKAVALRFGVTVQSIKDWETTLTFEAPVLKAIEDRKISAYVALTKFRNTPAEKQGDRLKDVLKAPGEAPKTKNMHKANAKFMARDEESPLGAKYLLVLQWVHGEATTAECEREITGFKAALARAKKAMVAR